VKRLDFLATSAAFAALPGVAHANEIAVAHVTTQSELFGALPKPTARMWTRIILGQGVKYQKQIGLGVETAADGTKLSFVELQVGSPGGDCNPNTLRKSYLEGRRFGSLVQVYPLISNIGRSANLIFRYGDVTDEKPAAKADVMLKLLDNRIAYDDAPLRVVSSERVRLTAAGHSVETTHVTCVVAGPSATGIKRIDLWHAPSFPFGLVRYQATMGEGVDPYEMSCDSFGTDYKTDLPMTLANVRAVTKDGAYGSIPPGAER